MPVVGLLDGNGVETNWEDLEKTYYQRHWIVDPDMTGGWHTRWPLPMLLAIAGERATQLGERAGRFRVSTLAGSPTRAILMMRFNYYVTPESLLFMLDGTAFHAFLDRYAPGASVGRLKATVKHSKSAWQKTVVTGELDYLQLAKTDNEVTLYEYKRTGAYMLKKCTEEGIESQLPWLFQIRTYRELLMRKFPHLEVTQMRLFVFARDWRNWGKDPRMAEFVVLSTADDWRNVRRAVRKRREAQALPPDELPACEDRDAYGYGPAGLPKRCVTYCEVSKFCPAFASGKV